MPAKIDEQSAFEATGVILMNRVQGNSGTNITQAAITSISYNVTRFDSRNDAYNVNNGTAVVTAGSLLKTAVVFDTLQTSAPWDVDTAGYNVRYDSPATDRPAVSGGGSYWHRYDIAFTPASGAVFVVSWIVESLPRT